MSTEGARAALNLSGTVLGFYPVRVLPSKTAILPVNPTFLPRVRITISSMFLVIHASLQWSCYGVLPFYSVSLIQLYPLFSLKNIIFKKNEILMPETGYSQRMSGKCVRGQFIVPILIRRYVHFIT